MRGEIKTCRWSCRLLQDAGGGGCPQRRFNFHGEKIAQVIEHKFLWIAQPGGENFQTAPIWLAAEKRAGAVIRQLLPLVRFHPIPPISDAPIRPPIRSLHHPVKIMAVEGKPHAETAEHLLQRRLRFLRLRSRQSPNMGDAGQPYTAIRRWAICSLLKKAQHLTAIRLAVTVRIAHAHEVVRQHRVKTHWRCLFPRMALHEGQSLLHTARGTILIQSQRMLSRVLRAMAIPMMLRNVEPALTIEAHRHRISKQRLRRP